MLGSHALLVEIPIANPVNQSSVLNIETNRVEIVQLRLFNSSGKLMSTQTVKLFAGTQKVALPVAALPTGNYIVSISGSSYNKEIKFIK